MKRFLLSIVIFTCLFTVNVQANATYTWIRATKGVNDAESPEKLFDGSTRTKWCVKHSSSKDDSFMIFKTDRPISITGYIMTTGNDNSIYKGRNPRTWTLYGASEKLEEDSKDWKVIDSRDEDSMKDVDYAPFRFFLKSPAPKYQYYKLLISETQGSEVMQLSEFELLTENDRDALYPTVTVVKGTDGVVSKEGYACLLDGTVASKWCVKTVDNPYVIWYTSEPITVTGYTLYTGNDTSSYTGRNPIAWKLYGCLSDTVPSKDSDKWKIIYDMHQCKNIPTDNYAPYEVKLTNPMGLYDVFMLKLTKSNGADLIQLSEFVLSSKEYTFPVSTITGTNVGEGGESVDPGGHEEIGTLTTLCYKCHGNREVDCSACDGRGSHTRYGSTPNYSGNSKTSYSYEEKCSKCHGSGKMTCPACHGSGRN